MKGNGTSRLMSRCLPTCAATGRRVWPAPGGARLGGYPSDLWWVPEIDADWLQDHLDIPLVTFFV